MSGEGAVGFAVVAVVGGSVWLAARGIEAGALVAARSVELLGSGLAQIGEHAERSRAEWEAGHAALLEWEAAARQVLEVNARLMVLREQPGLHGDLLVTLPPPLSLCAESPEEMLAWCAAGTAAVEAVQRSCRERDIRATVAMLRRSTGREHTLSAHDVLARFHEALAASADAAIKAGAGAAAAVAAEIVARLPVDVADGDRATVLAAADRVAALRAVEDHDVRLDNLRLCVQRAVASTTAARDDAHGAAMLLQAIAGDPDPELPGTRAALADVLARRRTLDAPLRAQAERAVERARQRLEREYVRASIAATLAELGYEVDEGFSTISGDQHRMRMVRPQWRGHAVQVVVGDEEVRAALVRLEAHDGVNARREDREREAQWCADLAKLRTSLPGAGVHVEQRRLTWLEGRTPPVVRRKGRDDTAGEQRQRPRPA